jgi:hypothetical protein
MIHCLQFSTSTLLDHASPSRPQNSLKLLVGYLKLKRNKITHSVSHVQVFLNHAAATNVTISRITPYTDFLPPAYIDNPPKLHATSLLGKALVLSVSIDALNYHNLYVQPKGTRIMAKVLSPDLRSCAGTVHIVDSVLFPAV